MSDSPPAWPAIATRDGPLKMAALDPKPQLPDADQSPCPDGSGLAACFTHRDAIRQNGFKILHDDRNYSYERAVENMLRGDEVAAKNLTLTPSLEGRGWG